MVIFLTWLIGAGVAMYLVILDNRKQSDPFDKIGLNLAIAVSITSWLIVITIVLDIIQQYIYDRTEGFWIKLNDLFEKASK